MLVMLDRIERDWISWAGSARGRRRLQRWAASRPELAGWAVDDLRSPVGGPRTDAMQAVLVDLAQRGDDIAPLTLVVQLRPGVLRIVNTVRRRPERWHERRDETVADVVGALTETIMRHPLARRPSAIASNLLLDTRQRLDRAERRAGRLPTTALTHPVAEPAGSPPRGSQPSVGAPEQVIDRLDAVAALTTVLDDVARSSESRRLTAEVAFRAWFLEERSPDIGAAVGLQPDAVRARLSRLRTAVVHARAVS